MRRCRHRGFSDINDQKTQFYARYDADSIAEANYHANKDFVDHQFGLMLKTFNEGVYFNAGMFYGRIFNVIFAPVQAETEEPVIEEPVTEEPVTEEPVIEEPVTEESAFIQE